MIITYLLLAFAVINPIQTNVWRGIVPLHSTRHDVEQVLGKPDTKMPDYASYKIGNQNVSIRYTSGPCEGSSGGWRVPKETVLEISVFYLKPKPRFADLKLSEGQYQERIEGDKEDLVSYRDDHRGVVFVVDKDDGLINSVRYVPSANDDHLKCPSSGEQTQDVGIGDSRKFDEYSKISESERSRRLNNFALQLMEYESDATGYILACTSRSDRAPKTSAAKDAKNYLVSR